MILLAIFLYVFVSLVCFSIGLMMGYRAGRIQTEELYKYDLR